MSKYVIQSKRGAPPLGAYSQGWRAGDFIFVTGSGPVDPATGKIVGETIEQQTDLTITNLAAILEADSATLADVVKVSVHLKDPSLFPRYNEVYARRFAKPYPVRTTVGSDLSAAPGMLIEIDCIAYKPQPRRASKPQSRRASAPQLRKSAPRPRSRGRKPGK